MANRFVGKMIIIDTTDKAIGGDSPDIGPKGPLSIRAIKWVSTQNSNKDIGNDDDLTLLDKKGGTKMIECRAQLAAVTGSVVYSVEFGGEPWTVPGFYIEDIDGGELQIFLA